MLLTGTTFQDGADGLRIEIDGYYVPKQEVSGASVKNIDEITRAFIAEKKIVAGIHSHVNMNVFFSTTDDETCRSGILHHLVVNNDMKFIGRSRFMLPCGMAFFKDMEFEFEDEPEAAKTHVEGIENITPMGYSWQKDRDEWNTRDAKDDKAPINDADPDYSYQNNHHGWTEEEMNNWAGHGKHKQISLFGADGKILNGNGQKKTVIEVMKDGVQEDEDEDYGMSEGGYTYDKVNDMYYLDDDTVIMGMMVPRDPITKERYIYGTPTHPARP